MNTHQQAIDYAWATTALEEAIQTIKCHPYHLTYAQVVKLAQVMQDKVNELDGMTGLARVEDAAEELVIALDFSFAISPEERSEAMREQMQIKRGE